MATEEVFDELGGLLEGFKDGQDVDGLVEVDHDLADFGGKDAFVGVVFGRCLVGIGRVFGGIQGLHELGTAEVFCHDPFGKGVLIFGLDASRDGVREAWGEAVGDYQVFDGVGQIEEDEGAGDC